MNRTNPARALPLIVACCLLVLVGCSPEEDTTTTTTPTTPTTTEEAPTLPPVGSISVDFSAFGLANPVSGLGQPAAGAMLDPGNPLAGPRSALPPAIEYPVFGSYYNDAAIVVTVWNIIIVVGFAPPVYAFSQAVNTTPVYQGDLTWLWEYTTPAFLARTWTADLTGSLDLSAGEVTWVMSLSSTPQVLGCCTDFHWFTGVQSGATSGYWQFYDPTTPSTAAPTIRVDWSVTSDTVRSLTFTNNSDAPATDNWGNGSYLQYALSGADLTVTIQNSVDTYPTLITLDTGTGEGSIRYNDGATLGCWDSSQADVTCP